MENNFKKFNTFRKFLSQKHILSIRYLVKATVEQKIPYNNFIEFRLLEVATY